MRLNPSKLNPRSRRHVIRLAALFGASAAFGLISGARAKAAGRHSDPFFCEPACLLRGSRIETVTGEVAIENLQTGDLIRTVDGHFKKVTWVGRQALLKRAFESWSPSFDPVFIMKSAIAPGIPAHDLYLSPRHALFIDGYLIPTMFLINGVSVRQGVFAGDAIEYFHVECETHEVMIADGLPVETYRFDEANPENFENLGARGADSHRIEAYAPVLGYWTIRADAMGLLRSIASSCIDLRDPIQVVYDRISSRAVELADIA